MSIFSKGSKAYSMFAFKCPRCQIGDLYETPTFSFRKPFFMPKNCPHCGQRYELEAGFYYGAMFMSYIITATLIFSLFAVAYFLMGFSVFWSFASVTGLIFILYIWIFRLSRSMWINFFVKYNPKL